MPSGIENSGDDAGIISPPRSKRRISFAVVALILIITFQHYAARIMSLPLNRVIEARYCLDYYKLNDPSVIPPGNDIPEDLCKVNEVQKKLAWLHGSIETLHVFCDLLVTLPWAYVSDRYGRKLILFLNTFGMSLIWTVMILVGKLQEIPVEWMIAGPILTLIGGGECVLISTVAAGIADFVPDQGLRTTVFAYMSSVTYITTLSAPAVAAYTMSVNLWLPFWIGLGLLVLAILTSLTLPAKPTTTTVSAIESSLPEETSPLLRNAVVPDDVTEPDSGSAFHKAYAHLKSMISSIVNRPMFQLLISIFFLASFASSSSPLFVQYISKRYQWTFSRAGYLLTIKAAVNVVLLTVIVPFLVHFTSTTRRMPGRNINIYGVQINLMISIIGSLAIAASPKIGALVPSALVIYALGSALPVFTMSLVKYEEGSDGIGEQNDGKGQDYSIVILAKTFGSLLGIPFMTAVWAKGITLGGGAMGFPFHAGALVYSIAGVLALKLEKVQK